MSLFNIPIGKETPIYQQMTTTSAVVLYTAGKNGAAVVALMANEMAGATPTITLAIHNSSGTAVARRANAKPLAAREILALVKMHEAPIVLLPDHSLRATASAANQIDIDGVVIEPPQRGS